MKIICSIDLESAERDIKSITSYPISGYSKSDILNGIGASYIVLLFDYWEQKVVIVEDSILSFLFNLKGALNSLKSGNQQLAFVFSIEQGFSMQLRLKENVVEIEVFKKKYKVGLDLIELEIAKSSKRACFELVPLYPGLEENKYFIEIRNYLIYDSPE